mmetsp:Transcript_15629/g.36590  ORF Transcript_15629/g.36590 Transcript_15629/m.36590 type:complete len:280 (-) Transcript_15629:660-1499(-)
MPSALHCSEISSSESPIWLTHTMDCNTCCNAVGLKSEVSSSFSTACSKTSNTVRKLEAKRSSCARRLGSKPHAVEMAFVSAMTASFRTSFLPSACKISSKACIIAPAGPTCVSSRTGSSIARLTFKTACTCSTVPDTMLAIAQHASLRIAVFLSLRSLVTMRKNPASSTASTSSSSAMVMLLIPLMAGVRTHGWSCSSSSINRVTTPNSTRQRALSTGPSLMCEQAQQASARSSCDSMWRSSFKFLSNGCKTVKAGSGLPRHMFARLQQTFRTNLAPVR